MVKKKRAKKVQSKGRIYSPLDKHKQHKKILTPPMMGLENRKFSSWINDCLPNILWACILAGHLERTHYLKLFRRVVISTREKIQDYKYTFVTHNHVSTYSSAQFDTMFADVLADNKAADLLSALLLVECLPDAHHWKRHLKEPEVVKHGTILAYAVGRCFGHQTQEATDVRWLKLMHTICMGRMFFPEEMSERLEELRCYPDKGDMRSVRPHIRAAEMSIRPIEFGDEPISEERAILLPELHTEKFWMEMLEKTQCSYIGERNPPKTAEKELSLELFDTYVAVSQHFDNTLKNTNIDAKHDSAFGLTLYAISLALNSALTYAHQLVDGRLVLRSIMEACVVLHYLKEKDDDTLWMQYRNYGSGKAKLAFLKNEKDKVPDFMDAERLESLANEDTWMEFQNIPLGAWANSDLRSMAKETGIKDVYDGYYDWLASYTHANWGAVRDTVFDICPNPLHRFHRIPMPPNMEMPSIHADACKLINRMLEDLNALYPTLKVRLKLYKVSSRKKKSKKSKTDA